MNVSMFNGGGVENYCSTGLGLAVFQRGLSWQFFNEEIIGGSIKTLGGFFGVR